MLQNLTKKRAGFTLVEIMIVVAIIALLAAIAVPNFLRAPASARKPRASLKIFAWSILQSTNMQSRLTRPAVPPRTGRTSRTTSRQVPHSRLPVERTCWDSTSMPVRSRWMAFRGLHRRPLINFRTSPRLNSGRPSNKRSQQLQLLHPAVRSGGWMFAFANPTWRENCVSVTS